MKKKIIYGNWKMGPSKLAEAVKIAAAIEEISKKSRHLVGFAPPFVFLPALAKKTKSAQLGAQDVFWLDDKALPYTGEISLSQLNNFGVEFVIIGHSERRLYLKETDKMVNQKLNLVTQKKIGVLCVGEPKQVRKKGIARAKQFVSRQLNQDLKRIKRNQLKNLVVAYEPIWAISTNKNAKPDNPKQAAAMVGYIKDWFSRRFGSQLKVIYGGSTSAKNIFGFISQPEIDGVLVGGASLRPKEFKMMVHIANEII